MPQRSGPPWQYPAMIVAIGLTIVVGVVIIRSVPNLPPSDRAARPDAVTRLPGVRAAISAGERSARCSFPAPGFVLGPAQSLHPAIPAGGFAASFGVTIDPGSVRRARIGAELRGGSLIIRRGEKVLASDHAGAEARTLLSAVPEAFSRRLYELTYEFESDGASPASFRPLWQPVTATRPLPLPADGVGLLPSPELRGAVLVQKLNCVACHASTVAERQEWLATSPGPILGDVGGRVRPDWFRRWLRSPHLVKQGARMPALFHGGTADEDTIEDLTHFLASMSGPLLAGAEPDPDLVATGASLYHQVGCVACHGPRDRPELVGLESFVALPDLGAKHTIDGLAGFLLDPLGVRPAGLMPSLRLTELEAEAIASYLIAREDPDPHATFELDSDRIDRGRVSFGALGCANCHDLGENRTPIERRRQAPDLESLTGGALERGCLGTSFPASVPNFGFADHEREAIVAFLGSLETRRCENVPHDLLATSLARLRCTSCHTYHAETAPNPLIASYFTTLQEVDIGEEGRMPPSHSDLGARLTTAWMHQVIEEGASARPYLATRMPQFGARQVERLPELFARAAGVVPGEDRLPEVTPTDAEVGRKLVGANGFNCIQCHSIAGYESTGTPGPDLAAMPERLRYESFERWLLDPKSIRPSTRMPTFFVEGRSGLTEHYNGDALRQVAAIWAYLSLGAGMPLPEGLTEPDTFVLTVEDEPIVFRTFMDEVGVRAIACGYPEQVHAAFDAERCRVALVWTGQFLSAAGAWAARGGQATNPQEVAWRAPDEDVLVLVTPDDAEVQPKAGFRGYRLDDHGRPVFVYSLAFEGYGSVLVEEQPLPVVSASTSLHRRFELTGDIGTAALVARAVGGRLLSPDGRMIDGTELRLELDGDEHARFILEVTW